MQKVDGRVVHLVHWTKSGITTLVRDICKLKGHSFILFEKDSDFDKYYSDIVDKYCAKESVINFVKMVRNISPEIIHAHSFMPLLVALLFFRKSKIIFHVHNEYPYFYDNRIKSKIKRFILRVSKSVVSYKIICVSKESGESIKRITGSDYEIVVNGLPDEGSVRSLFDEKPDQYRFYSVCRLDDQKNLDYAISLIKDLSAKFNGVAPTYDIYGKGALYDSLSEKIEQSSAGSLVKLKGFVHEPQYLSEHYDYYISTSIYEGFGLSIVSAMRGRNIVFMTPVGDLPRYLSDGIEVIFLSLERTRDIEIISNFLSQNESRKVAVQRRARLKFISCFTQDKMLNDLDKYYK
ncbi:glycosyltransferase family 4 protein [Marinobacter sp. ATCH36]|uniref:glycosyltransferase family 4 protein n=1 Tax=Marinobacter sp. ATCH36 TaxID=2945106 RepID=UPI002021CB90|nr:glycosyltransferase family 4 protein [Marinobacter sp. ATCH36]MCL7945692.1 glycosyltransferase family 4 protein [Marinobacter sp. ATCH36]